MTLNTFDLHQLLMSIQGDLLADEGKDVALLLPDSSSREYLVSSVIHTAHKNDFDVQHIGSAEALQALLQELSLFATKTLYVVHGVSFAGITVGEISMGTRLFFAAESKDALPKNRLNWSIYTFPQEKPWDQQARVLAWTKELFQRHQKIPTQELLATLASACEYAFTQISSEVEKICLYAGDEKNISLQLAGQVSTFSHSEKEWNRAENIVWHELVADAPPGDHAEFFRFLGLLRYHLHLGLSLAFSSDPLSFLKKRYPKLLKKGEKVYVPKVKALGKEYFINGNMALFELERNLRTASSQSRHFWDTFIINMRCHI